MFHKLICHCHFHGPPGNDSDKSVCETSKTFFFNFLEITSKSGENCCVLPRRPFFYFYFLRSHQNPGKIVAFSSSFLELTKPEMPNI